MAFVLRTTFKYAFRRLDMNKVKSAPTILMKRTSEIEKLLSKSVHLESRYLSNYSIDQKIQDLSARIRLNKPITSREVENIIEEIKTTGFSSADELAIVIQWCGNLLSEELPENKIRMVKKLWNTMETLDMEINIIHYNALLKVYLENDYKFDPANILKELENKNIEPNPVTYKRCLVNYSQAGNVEGATFILETMKEKKIPMDEITFNALVLVYCRANDMAGAGNIFSVMKNYGIDPTPETYLILIRAYVERGETDKVNSLMKKYNNSHILKNLTRSDEEETLSEENVHLKKMLVDLWGEEVAHLNVRAQEDLKDQVLNRRFNFDSMDLTSPELQLSPGNVH